MVPTSLGIRITDSTGGLEPESRASRPGHSKSLSRCGILDKGKGGIVKKYCMTRIRQIDPRPRFFSCGAIGAFAMLVVFLSPVPLPAEVTSTFIDGQLEVVSDGEDSIDIAVSGGNVTVNGLPPGGQGSPDVPAADVTSIVVVGGQGTNTITLEAVTRADFPNLIDGNVHIAGDPLAGEGTDFIIGSEFADMIYGGNGLDFVSGGPGQDTVFGEGGNDEIAGCGGDDLLYGGVGDDKLYGEGGYDWLAGMAGNDKFCYSWPGSRPAAGGSRYREVAEDDGGSDTLDFSTCDALVTIDLDLQDVDQVVDAAGHILCLMGQFENFIGTAYEDTVNLDPLGDPRHIDGGDVPGGGVRADDVLLFDAQGVPVTDDGSTIIAEGYAPVTYVGIETVIIVNAPPAVEELSWGSIKALFRD